MSQISLLKEQLAQEAKRRQMYVLRSTKASREMQQLRQTLGDSLRHVSQEPIDAMLLEHEARRLEFYYYTGCPKTQRQVEIFNKINNSTSISIVLILETLGQSCNYF